MCALCEPWKSGKLVHSVTSVKYVKYVSAKYLRHLNSVPYQTNDSHGVEQHTPPEVFRSNLWFYTRVSFLVTPICCGNLLLGKKIHSRNFEKFDLEVGGHQIKYAQITQTLVQLDASRLDL